MASRTFVKTQSLFPSRRPPRAQGLPEMLLNSQLSQAVGQARPATGVTAGASGLAGGGGGADQVRHRFWGGRGTWAGRGAAMAVLISRAGGGGLQLTAAMRRGAPAAPRTPGKALPESLSSCHHFAAALRDMESTPPLCNPESPLSWRGRVPVPRPGLKRPHARLMERAGLGCCRMRANRGPRQGHPRPATSQLSPRPGGQPGRGRPSCLVPPHS